MQSWQSSWLTKSSQFSPALLKQDMVTLAQGDSSGQEKKSDDHYFASSLPFRHPSGSPTGRFYLRVQYWKNILLFIIAMPVTVYQKQDVLIFLPQLQRMWSLLAPLEKKINWTKLLALFPNWNLTVTKQLQPLCNAYLGRIPIIWTTVRFKQSQVQKVASCLQNSVTKTKCNLLYDLSQLLGYLSDKVTFCAF